MIFKRIKWKIQDLYNGFFYRSNYLELNQVRELGKVETYEVPLRRPILILGITGLLICLALPFTNVWGIPLSVKFMKRFG